MYNNKLQLLLLPGMLLLAIALPASGAIPNLAGPWTVTESATLVTTINGQSQTDTQSGSGNITLTQNGSTVTYYQDIPNPAGGTYRAQRVGTIVGNTVTFTGIAMVPVQGITLSKNSMVAVGTISMDGRRIDATSTVNVVGNGSGYSGTIKGGGTEVFISTAPETAPTIATGSPLPVGTAGKDYNQMLSASGGRIPHSWAIASGSLPPGLSLSDNGAISGICGIVTTANFTVQVTGNNGLSSTKVFSLAILAETTKPILTITSPTSGLQVKTNSGQWLVKGTASDNVGVAQVRVNLNNTGWQLATGTTAWQTLMNLQAGPNMLSAYAVDAAGNRSPTNAVNFTYILTAPLSRAIVGTGTVTGATNGQRLEIGKIVTLTAKPGIGHVLTNWLVQVDGLTVLSTNRAVPFMMRSNLLLTVTFADVAKPVLTITAPTANERWSNAVFTVAGKATDNGPLAGVSYQLNGGAWATAQTANGWSNWTAGVTLTRGTNSVSAYAMDAAGNRSATNSQKVVYMLSAPINLNVVGKGSLIGAVNGQLLEIGKSVNLTNKPARGYLLTNWLVQVDGLTVLSTNRAMPFLMQSNLVLTATFVDVMRPTNTITVPMPNQRWSNAIFTVAGKVTDNGPISNVWCQVNSGGWSNAQTANSWSNWTAGVTLKVGTNMIMAYAVDMAGNRSLTNNQKVVFVEMFTLVDYHPLPLGAHWLYLGTDADGFATKFSFDVTSTNYAITNYTGTKPVIAYRTNCVRVSAAYLSPTTRVPYEKWDEYMAIGGRFGEFGDDGFDVNDGHLTESMRVAGGFIVPAQMAVGSGVTLKTNAYMFGANAGTASVTFQLLEHTSITVPVGTFSDVLHMRWTMAAPDGSQIHDEWWAKSVGCVKRLHISGDSSAVSYELISYSLSPAPAIKAVLAHVLMPPSPPPQGESLSLVNGYMQLQWSGPAGAEVVVESSPDLIHWLPIQTNTVPADGLPLLVPVNQQPAQYFRARMP